MQSGDKITVVLTAREVFVLIEALAQYHINSNTVDMEAALNIEHEFRLGAEVDEKIRELSPETDEDYSDEDNDNE